MYYKDRAFKKKLHRLFTMLMNNTKMSTIKLNNKSANKDKLIIPEVGSSKTTRVPLFFERGQKRTCAPQPCTIYSER